MCSGSHTVTEEFPSTQSSNHDDYGKTEEFTSDLQILKDPSIPTPVDILHNAVNLFCHFKNCSTQLDRIQKVQLMIVLPTDWSVKFICKNFETTRSMVETERCLLASKGILASPDAKKGKLHQFYQLIIILYNITIFQVS